MLQFIQNSETMTVILIALLSISEALALIPSVKANSIFQLVISGIKKVLLIFSKPKA